MIGLALLLLQAVDPAGAAAMPTAAAAPRDAVPLDWSVLPVLPFASAPRMIPAYNQYVAGEIAAGRCGLTPPADGRWNIRLEVVALVDAGGAIRRLVPRAIGCPTIEQYAAGLVQAFARGNLSRPATPGNARWYRTSVTFAWAA